MGVWLCVGGAVGVWLCVGGAVGVWLCVGGAVGVWLCDGVAVAVLTWAGVVTDVGVTVVFTVVVLLELHPAIATAATAAVAMQQIGFVLSISPPRVAQTASMTGRASSHAPGRWDASPPPGENRNLHRRAGQLAGHRALTGPSFANAAD